MVQHLLERSQKNNKDGLKTYYLDEKQLSDKNQYIEKIENEKDSCIISIFSPILIQMKNKFKNELEEFIKKFKEKKMKFELLSVYLLASTRPKF